MDNSKSYYRYRFSNREDRTMTPIEAHAYAHKHKVDIIEGPNYHVGKRERQFNGWGWHASLQRSFKGPHDYRTYLRANNLIEAGNENPLQEVEFKKPLWDEDLIRKAIREYGMDIGGEMAKALLSGELDFPETNTFFDSEAVDDA